MNIKITIHQIKKFFLVEAVAKEWLERAYNFFFGFLLYWIWFKGYWFGLELSPKRINMKIIVPSQDLIGNDLFIVRVFCVTSYFVFPFG